MIISDDAALRAPKQPSTLDRAVDDALRSKKHLADILKRQLPSLLTTGLLCVRLALEDMVGEPLRHMPYVPEGVLSEWMATALGLIELHNRVTDDLQNIAVASHSSRRSHVLSLLCEHLTSFDKLLNDYLPLHCALESLANDQVSRGSRADAMNAEANVQDPKLLNIGNAVSEYFLLSNEQIWDSIFQTSECLARSAHRHLSFSDSRWTRFRSESTDSDTERGGARGEDSRYDDQVNMSPFLFR